MEPLALEVTLWNDGGGRVSAARRPVRGVDKVARLRAIVGPGYAHLQARWVSGDAEPTVLLVAGDAPRVVLVVEVDDLLKPGAADLRLRKPHQARPPRGTTPHSPRLVAGVSRHVLGCGAEGQPTIAHGRSLRGPGEESR